MASTTLTLEIRVRNSALVLGVADLSLNLIVQVSHWLDRCKCLGEQVLADYGFLMIREENLVVTTLDPGTLIVEPDEPLRSLVQARADSARGGRAQAIWNVDASDAYRGHRLVALPENKVPQAEGVERVAGAAARIVGDPKGDLRSADAELPRLVLK